MKKLLIIIVFFFGCSHIHVSGAPKKEKMFRVHHINVKVVFVDNETLQGFCPEPCNGIWYDDEGTIFVRQPRSWSDMERIETIGHEILHEMGYAHSMPMKFDEQLVGGNYQDY